MKTGRHLIGGLALLALVTFNVHLSIAYAQGLIITNWNDLVTNWVQTSAPSEGWSFIASSSDGTQLAAVANYGLIYTSTNAGVTWTQSSATSNYWTSIASSSDGTHLAAGGYYTGIYTSTNAGLTWTQTSAPSDYWKCIASSSDGTMLAGATDTDGIWTSTNAARLGPKRPGRLKSGIASHPHPTASTWQQGIGPVGFGFRPMPA